MKFKKIIICFSLLTAANVLQSCNKFLDVNVSPNAQVDVGIAQLLPSITVNVGYMGGSDLFRYSGLIVQQFSGQTTNTSQTFKEYERYNINNSDVNNAWGSIFSTTLADIAKLITKGDAERSPHYSGVGRILKAYVYQLSVDAWGDLPYTEATQFTENYYPKFDDDEAIYANLIPLIDQGIANLNAPVSALDPNNNTSIYANTAWVNARTNWIKFANTLKLRIFLHYSQKDPAFARTQITALINSGAQFMTSTADNFQMPYYSTSGNQNPISTIEGGQFRNAFFPNRTLVNIMNAKADPRRSSFFVPFPYNSSPASYKGASVLDNTSSVAYSRLNTYLKGTAAVGTVVVNTDGTITDASITWSGNAPARLLTFAEYNFIRAEAALLGAPGDAQAFFQAGIQASMTDAGVSAGNATAYIAANGTLSGTNAQMLEKIITEKYVANFGVVMESWTDWRRTGYPASVVPLPISIAVYDQIPRSLFYPLSETSNNPNITQKPSMLTRVFWDTRP